ncbi:excalibur calcium-binding domain-containing protein [Kocuria sabuli]|uniref:excalibur calcium-binding domain-containing protein n=1 Tax=Kocuria sabuli TaxID=3071448 RepID=UPI0034D7502B
MTFPPSSPRHVRGRSAAAWTSAAMAMALLTGCSSTPAEPGTNPAVAASPTTSPPAASSPAASSPASSPAAPSAAAETPTTTPAQTPPPATLVASSEALTALNGLTVAARGTMSDYDREGLFGSWIDADGNCADTRQEILARDLDDVVSTDGCRVDAGVLDPDPYTGATITFVRGPATSSEVQIDHVVALGNAWITGARNLTQHQRVELANDPLNLLAVDGPTNQAKSDKAAVAWLPPNESFRCEFVAIQIAVKAKDDLWVTAPEKTAMTQVLTDCEDQELPTDATVAIGDIAANAPAPAEEAPAPAPEPIAPAPAPVEEAPAPAPDPVAPAPAVPGVPAGGWANCTEARAAGAAPIYRGSPGYAPKLDRDGDGVACE